MALTPRQASYLRALAHALEPVVRVGSAGASDAVVDKTDRELENHELLKVKVDGDRDVVRAVAERLASGTGADVAQIIGKVVVLYRRRRKKPTIRLPAAD
jgi:RNA-binding protein